MECTLCLGYIIVLSSHCLVCGYLCVEGPPPLGRLLYELVLRSALVQVSAAARARLLYVLPLGGGGAPGPTGVLVRRPLHFQRGARDARGTTEVD
jgi:hypothetical protein